MSASKNHSLFNRFFISLWLINFLVYIAHTSMNNLISVYVSGIGLDTGFNGTLATAFAIFAILSRFLCGSLSDKIGRRILLIISAVVFAMGILFFGIFTLPFMLLFARGIQGFGFATNNQTVSAATADVMPQDKIGLGMGTIWLVQSIAAVLAATLVSRAIAAGSFQMLFIALTVIMLIAAGLGFVCNYEKQSEYQTQKPVPDSTQKGLSRFLEKRAIPASIIIVLQCCGAVGVTHFLYLYSDNIGYASPEVFFFVNAVTMFIASVVTARFSDKVNPLVLLVPAMLCGAAFNLLLAFSTGGVNVLMPIAGAFYGLNSGAALPLLNQMAVKASPDSRRGAASATFFLFMDVGIAVGAIVWGWAINAIDFKLTYILGAVCMGIGLVLSVVFSKDRKQNVK